MRDAFPDGREAIASLVPLLDEYLAAAAEVGDATGSRGTAADPDPR